MLKREGAATGSSAHCSALFPGQFAQVDGSELVIPENLELVWTRPGEDQAAPQDIHRQEDTLIRRPTHLFTPYLFERLGHRVEAVCRHDTTDTLMRPLVVVVAAVSIQGFLQGFYVGVSFGVEPLLPQGTMVPLKLPESLRMLGCSPDVFGLQLILDVFLKSSLAPPVHELGSTVGQDTVGPSPVLYDITESLKDSLSRLLFKRCGP